MKKQTQQTKREGVNVRIAHWLKKYDFRNQEQFTAFLQRLIFGVLTIVVAFMLLQHIGKFEQLGGWTTLFPLMVVAVLIIGWIVFTKLKRRFAEEL